MSAFPTQQQRVTGKPWHLGSGSVQKIMGYYGFPGFSPPDPDPAPDKPKPKTCLDVLKQHEEAVEKTLGEMPEIEKRIIYSVLNRQGVRMDHIDREIYKEAQKELKANG